MDEWELTETFVFQGRTVRYGVKGIERYPFYPHDFGT
jgi:hypothetical protein